MLGVGILGAGFFGAFHARAIAAIAGFRLVAVCAEESGAGRSFRRGARRQALWRLARDARRQLGRRGRDHRTASSALRIRGGRACRRQARVAGKADGAVGRRMQPHHRVSRGQPAQTDGRADHALRLALPRGARDPGSRRTRQARDGIELRCRKSGWNRTAAAGISIPQPAAAC